MPGKLVIGGRVPALQAQVAWLNTLQFGLFTNDVAIVDATVMADLTVGAWGGYVTTTPGTFASAVLDGSNHAVSTASAQSFLNTDLLSVTYRGWFLYDPTATMLVSAENFGADIPLAPGGTALLIPGFTDTTEF